MLAVIDTYQHELNDDGNKDIICECLRGFRNATAGCEINQTLFTPHLPALLSDDMFHDDQYKNIYLQFLANCSTNHVDNIQIVWQHIKPKFNYIVQHENPKVINTSCMILYNYLKLNEFSYEEWTEALSDIVNAFLKDSEFALFCLELCVDNSILFDKIFTQFRNCNMVLLDVISQTKSNVSLEIIKIIADHFKMTSEALLNCKMDLITEVCSIELVKFVQILGKYSSLDDIRPHLQEDKDFFIQTLYLLRFTHSAGKCQDSDVSIIDKLSEIEKVQQGTSSLIHESSFGFKRELVRLLGNLVHSHKVNQDLVRTHDGLPILLECTNMDARNPFITQWAILALRNLCMGNKENQSIISQMTLKDGPVNLESLTISLNENDGSAEVEYKTSSD